MSEYCFLFLCYNSITKYYSMAVLYRKYRPQTFKEVLGQEHIVKVLESSIELNKIAHAYIFSGSLMPSSCMPWRNTEAVMITTMSLSCFFSSFSALDILWAS